MSYEYFLVPTDNNKTVTQEVLEAMSNYIRSLPSYRWNDGSYVIFQTPQNRDRRVPQLLANRGKNDYLDPIVRIEKKEVMLSIVLNPDLDQYLYHFVLWCQKHWDCQLYYGGELVSPEELLVEP